MEPLHSCSLRKIFKLDAVRVKLGYKNKALASRTSSNSSDTNDCKRCAHADGGTPISILGCHVCLPRFPWRSRCLLRTCSSPLAENRNEHPFSAH
eukprot:1502086-Amphidinium_carterae.1